MQGVGVLRRQTRRFINEDPSELVLTRNTKVDDGAGGSTTAPTDLSSQTVKFTQTREGAATERRNDSGEVVRPTLAIVMEWDADVQRGDTFMWEGLTAEVVWVTERPFEKIAEVSV